jgi:hypothetical protein
MFTTRSSPFPSKGERKQQKGLGNKGERILRSSCGNFSNQIACCFLAKNIKQAKKKQRRNLKGAGCLQTK